MTAVATPNDELVTETTSGVMEIRWDKQSPTAVAKAETVFKEQKERGRAAFTPKGQTTTFDPEAEEATFVSPLQGG